MISPGKIKAIRHRSNAFVTLWIIDNIKRKVCTTRATFGYPCDTGSGAVSLALSLGLLTQYLQEHHKVRHISEAIRLYVPEEVSRALIGADLRPENVNQVTLSTCLATDMQGFSTIAESMNPGELAEFLNDYFETFSRPLRDHNVTVTEFRADAIMCAWTGPRRF